MSQKDGEQLTWAVVGQAEVDRKPYSAEKYAMAVMLYGEERARELAAEFGVEKPQPVIA